MTNVRCIRCGVVNPFSNEVCNVCGVELLPTPIVPDFPMIRRFDGVGDVLGPSISLFFKNFWLITKLVVVIVTPFEAFQILKVREIATDWQFTVTAYALQFFCKMLLAPALIYALTKRMETGVAPGVNESYSFALGKIGKVILCAMMTWVLQILGLIALIVPGIILMLAFEVVYPVAVLENESPVDTLKRSYRLTDGHKLKILGAGILMSLLLGMLTLPASAIPLLFGGVGGMFWPVAVLLAVFTDIISEGTTVLSLVIYLSILRTLEPRQSVIQ